MEDDNDNDNGCNYMSITLFSIIMTQQNKGNDNKAVVLPLPNKPLHDYKFPTPAT